MRILLIILQTMAFLIFVAAVLLALHLSAAVHHEDISHPHCLVRTVVFIFGNTFIDVAIFAIIAIGNIWFVVGPLMKVEEPATRTFTNLSVLFVQTMILLTIGIIGCAVMCLL